MKYNSEKVPAPKRRAKFKNVTAIKKAKAVKQTTQSLHEFFKVTQSGKQTRIAKADALAKLRQPKSTIGIPFRVDGEGKGSFHDHYTSRLITKTNTVIAPTLIPTSPLKHYIKSMTLNLFTEGEVAAGTKEEPVVSDNFGVLFVPGIAQNTYSDSVKLAERKKGDATWIKNALLKGQPILAICGGTWQVWEYFGGQLEEVKEHSYRGGMPSIKNSTGKVGRNVQIHRIKLAKKTLLSRAMAKGKLGHKKEIDFPVNSVHSLAIKWDESFAPHFEVSARAVRDDEMAPKSAQHQGRKIQPQEGIVEAFESRYGAPIICVQWHPEAYTDNAPSSAYPKNQQHILRFMAQAGQAFFNRQKLVAELKQKQPLSLRKVNELISDQAVFPVVKKSGVLKFTMYKVSELGELRHKRELWQELRAKEDYVLENGVGRVRPGAS